MKKSENDINNIDPNEIIKDINNILNVMNKITDEDLEDLNVKKLQEEAENIEKEIRNKYKHLDTEK